MKNSKLTSRFDFDISHKFFTKSKRSQVTIFIILTFVILAVALIFYTIKTKSSSENKEYDDNEINQINQLINDCVEQGAIDAIYLVGLQGGYVNLPKDYITTELSNIAYGLKNGRNTLPLKEKIQEEIKYYLELTLPFCINENDFVGLNISQKNPEVNVKIKDNEIEISVNMHTSIVKNQRTYLLDKPYKTEIPIQLGKIIKTANEIVEKHLQEPYHIDITFLTSLEYDVVFIPYDDKTLIYAITDEESKINEIPYSFMWGVENE